MRLYTHIAQGPGPGPPGGTPVITLCEKRRTLNEVDVKRRWTLWCPECIRRQLQIVHNLVPDDVVATLRPLRDELDAYRCGEFPTPVDLLEFDAWLEGK